MTINGAFGARRGMRAMAAIASVMFAGAAMGQDLQGRVSQLLDEVKLGRATVGVSIVDTRTGASLFARSADQQFMPASNMKLLTSGAALKVLGPDFSFRTEIQSQAERVVVKGSGDPALADPELLRLLKPSMTVDQLLTALAQAVVKEHTGPLTEVIVDDRVFDRETIHPGWPQDQLDRAYCAEVSGLNFHANVISVFFTPSGDGLGFAPGYRIQPRADWLSFDNRARTVGQGNNSVWVARHANENRFTIYGEVRQSSREPVQVTMRDNPLFFGQLLREEIVRAGLPALAGAGGDAKRNPSEGPGVRLAEPEESLGSGRVVAAVTTPLAEVLERCNSDSENLYAESLLKRMGHDVTGEPGSWANGGAVLRMTIGQLLSPSDAASVVVSDGSGLSRGNRVTPRLLTRWMTAMASNPEYTKAFLDSLAVPGEGTLRSRFTGEKKLRNELHAKSGLIRGVRCLSGYVTEPTTGRRVAFSILVNDLAEGDQSLTARALQDDIVVAIDRWLTRQANPGGQSGSPGARRR